MENNIIKRDGNLFQGNFPNKAHSNESHTSTNLKNKKGKLTAGLAAFVAVPSVIAGGISPSITTNGSRQEIKKPVESKLAAPPLHTIQSAQDMIRAQGKKKTWESSYVGQPLPTDGNLGKSR